jgi:DNA polymerase-3 subunit beta
MKFSITREALLKPLQLVAGVVERRQTLPILSNVLLQSKKGVLSLTGTDLEVEMVGRTEASGEDGEITLPAKKLLDICKSLPEAANLDFSLNNQRVTLKSGASKFTLATLPASEFPNVEDSPSALEITLKQKELKRLIDRTAFSMAQQDVRYYLNGMLFEIQPDLIRVVATDGHRLAMCTCSAKTGAESPQQLILPRKGVIELQRLLQDEEADVTLVLGANHLRATLNDFTFTTKLVDGKFPDYERVLPKGGSREVLAEREALRQAFSRTAILSNEKYRGVRVLLDGGKITMVANNPEQEEAEEQVSVDYSGDKLEIGFNVSYLVDVLAVLSGDQVKITLADSNSSALMEEAEPGDSVYVVMPMRL